MQNEGNMTDTKYGMADYEPADIVIYIQDKGMVLREKSLVAYELNTGKILAVGVDAERMLGKESENISVISPLRYGTVADYFVSVQLFTCLLEKAWGKKTFLKPSVAVCVPEDMTEVEKKALEEVICQSRAGKVVIIPIAVERFIAMAEIPGKLPPEYKKCRTIIGITKNEPEKYVMEGLSRIIQYAGRNGVSAERVTELVQKIAGEIKEQQQAVSADFRY